MKKLCILLAALTLSLGAPAQSFDRSSSDFFSLELTDWLEFNPLSYIYVGMQGPAAESGNGQVPRYTDHTNFGRSVEFGFNLAELVIRPYITGAIGLGANLNWNYFNLFSDYLWVPYSNGTNVTIMDKMFLEHAPVIRSIKKSTLSVMSFDFPLNFTQYIGPFSITVGATAKINLAGRHRFRGVDSEGNKMNMRKSGIYFSKDIKTNLFTYDIHAAFAYGGLGLYVKYKPMAVLSGPSPEFTVWTIGLILGLDM